MSVPAHEAAPDPIDLEIKRDARGYIQKVKALDEYGEEVEFEFERDGKHSLKKIRMK
jgi:hypothetical protein